MSNSLDYYLETIKQYNTISDEVKRECIEALYTVHNLSWTEIAEAAHTYTNRIRRDAKRFNIESRSKSDAQKLALEKGRHIHPTKGKTQSSETKLKISKTMEAKWENMDESTREKRSKTAQDIWNQKTPTELREIREAAGDGVRKAAKEGSKLEKEIFKALIHAGYKVDFHKEHFLLKERFQIDIFLPAENVAIEVDGPSHFDNIWGEKNLQKNKGRDHIKTGLLLQKGICIIRVQQTKALSQAYVRNTIQKVLDKLAEIKVKFPELGERNILIS